MKYEFRLFVTGRTDRATRSIRALEEVCAEHLTSFSIEVIDVLEDPARAEREKILATPTLVRVLPTPIRKVIGDLSEKEKVVVGLEIRRSQDDSSSRETNP